MISDDVASWEAAMGVVYTYRAAQPASRFEVAVSQYTVTKTKQMWFVTWNLATSREDVITQRLGRWRGYI